MVSVEGPQVVVASLGKLSYITWSGFGGLKQRKFIVRAHNENDQNKEIIQYLGINRFKKPKENRPFVVKHWKVQIQMKEFE